MSSTTVSPRILAALMTGLLTVACGGGPELPRDGKDDGFGAGKADGTFTDCQLIEVVNFANESTTTVDSLEALDIHPDAASALMTHRLGPDGQAGTGDDDLFDDLAELDSVDFVGSVTLDFMVAAVLDRCEADLQNRPFIDDQTFAGGVGGGFTRENAELEAAMTVGGITGSLLNEILTRTDDRDRTIFSRLRRTREIEAFSYSYPIDEIPWSGSVHDARESFPLLAMSIENGRFEPDDDGRRELSLGTDIMDDVYFDTLDYRLLRSDMVLRGRVRWDAVDVVRRLLIAAKFGSSIDDNGLKRAEKIDIRTSNGDHRETLEQDMTGGLIPWNGSPTGAEPIRAVYDALSALGVLPDIGAHNDVLLLDPKAHLRGTRSRYHLNLASTTAMKNFHRNGDTRIALALEMIEAAIAGGGLDPAVEAAAQDLQTLGQGLLDRTLVASEAEAELLAIDPTMTVTADSIVRPENFPAAVASHDDLQKNRVVAETVDRLYHAFAGGVDDIDRELTGTRGLDFDDFVDMFAAWHVDQDAALAIKTTYRPHLERYEEIDSMTDTDRQAQIDAFNTFAAARQADGDDDFDDFEPVTDEIWDALGRHLRFEVLKVSQRQIEAAGTVANAIWFDNAREFFVPDSFRPSGNFLIDTIDFTQMVTRTEWESIPEAERGIDIPIDPAKIFNASLVNEVQIELGMEDEYLDRIAELEERIADGSATPEDERDLEGVRFVFDRMTSALPRIAELRADRVLDRLDDEGAPGTIEWVPSEHSKGKTALMFLSDRL